MLRCKETNIWSFAMFLNPNIYATGPSFPPVSDWNWIKLSYRAVFILESTNPGGEGIQCPHFMMSCEIVTEQAMFLQKLQSCHCVTKVSLKLSIEGSLTWSALLPPMYCAYCTCRIMMNMGLLLQQYRTERNRIAGFLWKQTPMTSVFTHAAATTTTKLLIINLCFTFTRKNVSYAFNLNPPAYYLSPCLQTRLLMIFIPSSTDSGFETHLIHICQLSLVNFHTPTIRRNQQKKSQRTTFQLLESPSVCLPACLLAFAQRLQIKCMYVFM